MREKKRKFSQEDLCKMMPELDSKRQLPIVKYITKIPNAVLLDESEKEKLYTKRNLNINNLHLLVIGTGLFLLSGFLMLKNLSMLFFINIENCGMGAVIITGLAMGILFSIWILGMYLVQLYCERRREKREIHKYEVYRVPVMPYISFRDGSYRKARYYIKVSGGKKLLFSESVQISREQYQALDRFSFYAYYYEIRGKRDDRKYKVYVIGEKSGQ